MPQQKFIPMVFGLVLCGLMCVTQATYGAERLALIFGNNQYAQLTDLVKAVNDAAAMAQELTAAGFRVINSNKYSNLDRRAMLDARDDLMLKLSAGDQVVVFYAGHGVQIGSEIYLMPVSFPLLKVASAERVAEESVTLQSIMDAVKQRIGADGFALYVVDACRNNPLSKTAGRSIPEMSKRGLVPMQPPAGQIAIYAASNGQTALDVINDDDSDPNGVFTRVLLRHIRKPGEPIMDVLAEVQEEVIQLAAQSIDSDGRAHEQQPAIYNEARLKRPFCFYPNEYGCVRVPVVVPSVPSVPPVVPTVAVPTVAVSTVAVSQLVQLTVRSNILPGLDQVVIDGESRGSTKLVTNLEPGIHNVQVTAAGFKPWEQQVELTGAYSVYAKLEPVAVMATESPPIVAMATESPPIVANPTSQLISGRYRDNGDGTVTDITTNLRWKRCSEGQSWTGNTCSGEASTMTWNQAMPNGSQKSWPSFAGYSDWRVPTKAELVTLVYCSSGTPKTWNDTGNSCSGNYQRPTIDVQAFPNTPTSWFRSADAYGSSSAWFVFFYSGTVYGYSRGGNYAVRLARGGQ